MARTKTKEELIKAATSNYETLWEIISGLTEQEIKIPFDFSQDLKKLTGNGTKIFGIFSFICISGISFY